MRLTEERYQIRNTKGKRIFDVVKTDKKIFLETCHKGEMRRITLVEEIRQIYMALTPKEKIRMFKELKNLMDNDATIA